MSLLREQMSIGQPLRLSCVFEQEEETLVRILNQDLKKKGHFLGECNIMHFLSAIFYLSPLSSSDE
jgi:hypothetical protein